MKSRQRSITKKMVLLVGTLLISLFTSSASFAYDYSTLEIAPLTGYERSRALGINNGGQMVGIMWDSDQAGATEHAFIFDTTNGVRDLNSLIDSSTGWVLNFARDINDNGQIVGYGELNGLKRGFVLNPIQAPAAFNNLTASFSQYGTGNGLWTYNGTFWKQPTTWVPDEMVAWGSNSLAASFSNYGSGNGLWNYNGTSWSKLTDWVPADFLAWGDSSLAATFSNYGAGNGIWSFNGTAWSKMTDWIPGGFVSVGTNSFVAGFKDYGSGNGLWRYSGSWTQLTDWVPEAMTDTNVF